jgi:hypothetical protein
MTDTDQFKNGLSVLGAKNLLNNRFSRRLADWIEKEYLTKKTSEALLKNLSSAVSEQSIDCASVKPLAFGGASVRLESIYIPLTLTPLNHDSKPFPIIDNYNIFSSSRHILIEDRAGMGKSTVCRKIYLNILRKTDEIPLFIELRRIGKDPLLKYIKDLVDIPDKVGFSLLDKLPITFIFDGLDEVRSDFRDDLIEELIQFCQERQNEKIVISSRSESFLSVFTSFATYSIQELNQEEAFSLFKKYDVKGDVYPHLIDGLEREQSTSINEYLTTPLYVSLLFLAYKHKPLLPQKKSSFYSQVFEALFESHDLSKQAGFIREKKSGLDSSDFKTILRRLGFWCLNNNLRVEFDRHSLEVVIDEIVGEISNIDVNTSRFINDLVSAVPVFTKEGANYRWSHKSLMEYFASTFICYDTKEKQEDVLRAVFDSSNFYSYLNILELCADIDFATFRRVLIEPVFNDFVSSSQKISSEKIHQHELLYGRKVYVKTVDPDELLKIKLSLLDIFDLDPRKINITEHRILQRVVAKDPAKMLVSIVFESKYRAIMDIAAAALSNKAMNKRAPELDIKAEDLFDLQKKLAMESKGIFLFDGNNIKSQSTDHMEEKNKLIALCVIDYVELQDAKTELEIIREDKTNGIKTLIGGLNL